MSVYQCEICLNKKRSVKFKSGRLNICQWCVTKINKNTVSPRVLVDNELRNIKQVVRENVLSEIEDGLFELNLSEGFEPEKPLRVNEHRLRSNAETLTAKKEGVLKYIYRSVVDDSERQKEIHETFNNLQKDENLRYSSCYTAYLKELKQFNEKKESYINNKMISIEALADQTIREWLEGLRCNKLCNTQNDIILKAYFRGLINAEQELVERLSPEDMKPYREQILKQDDCSCRICKRSKIELHIHHIIFLECYGTHNPRNLITLCHPCHNALHENKVTRNLPLKRGLKTGGEFVAVDIKTTGFSNEDEILKITAVKFYKGKPSNKFSALIKTKSPISDLIADVLGVTQSMIDRSPEIEYVFPRFLSFIENHKLVVHNKVYCLRFLNRYSGNNFQNKAVDTMELSREKMPYIENHKLKTLTYYFRINLDFSEVGKTYFDATAIGFIYIYSLRITKKMVREKQFLTKG